jgi:hypothetical protein
MKYNVISAKTNAKSSFYFSSTDGKERTPVFSDRRHGYTLLMNLNDKYQLTCLMLQNLLYQLMNLPIPNLPKSFDDFFVKMEEENQFLIKLSEHYHRLEGYVLFEQNHCIPLLRENLYATYLKVDLYFAIEKSEDNEDFIIVANEFTSKKVLRDWLNHEAPKYLNTKDILRLMAEIHDLNIEELPEENPNSVIINRQLSYMN